MPEYNGILLINKPQNITSHGVVNKMRRAFGTKKIGHSGTLDPQATGLLCVLVGKAVKASDYAMSEKKGYHAEIKLGYTSDTEDIWGKLEKKSEKIINFDEFSTALTNFRGEIMQIPPMYSALKIDGRKLCDIARKGETVERQPRKINIFSLSGEKIGENEFSLDIVCSKGTYIRTLCADIGEYLGTGAVMSSLCRTFCGNFSLENAYTVEEIENMTEDQRQNALIPTEKLFGDLKKVFLPPFYSKLMQNGCEIYLKKIKCDAEIDECVALYDETGFLGMGTVADFPDGKAIKYEIRC